MTLIAFKTFLSFFLAFIITLWLDPESRGTRTPEWYAIMGGLFVVGMLSSLAITLTLWVFNL